MVVRMAPPARTQPQVADVIALARALERDELRAAADARKRDHELAQRIPIDGEDRVGIALAWLDAVEEEDETVRSIHHRAETALHLTGVLIALAAVLLGWAATLAAFYFDGSGRVNVVSVMALLVAIPALLIVPFVIAALPSSLTARIPGASLAAALARGMSAGRLAPWLWRMFPRDLRDALALVSGRMKGHQRLYSNLQKWAVLRWSQVFAVTFQISALAACLVLVVFTDLAFGWSTTLTSGDAALDAERMRRITSAIATPWSWAIDDAVPSTELIKQSRYYRVAGGSVSRTEAAQLGNWWRFVALAIAVYGLLPRVVTLGIARSRLRAATRAAVMAEPGLSAVLRRLHRSQIETRALEPETIGGSGLVSAGERAPPTLSDHIRAVINWSGVPASNEIFAATFPGARVYEAGGAATVQADAALAHELGAMADRGDAVIVVKAWEPPLMEFIDFLNTLRVARKRDGAMTFVLPVGLDHTENLGAATPEQFKLWRDKLAAIGDPRLRVAATPGEVRT
jgi:hypothetical protein